MIYCLETTWGIQTPWLDPLLLVGRGHFMRCTASTRTGHPISGPFHLLVLSLAT